MVAYGSNSGNSGQCRYAKESAADHSWSRTQLANSAVHLTLVEGGTTLVGSCPLALLRSFFQTWFGRGRCSVSCSFDANEPMRTHRNRTKDPPEAHERAFSLSVGTVDTTIVLACSLSFPLSEPPVNLPFT